jgi:hypothetical protein
MVPDIDDDETDITTKSVKAKFNFASQAAGAVILNYSPENGKGISTNFKQAE